MNNRTLMLTAMLALGLALPVGFAQDLYVGATLGTPLPGDTYELGAQFGLNFFPNFGVRASAEGDFPSDGVKLASLDALYSFYLPLSTNSIYFGGGADVFFSGPPDSVEDVQNGTFAAHAVAGAEFRLGRFGLFGEVQPSYLVGTDFSDENAYYLRARGGVNFHF